MNKDFLCNQRKCKQRFANIELFLKDVKEVHQSSSTSLSSSRTSSNFSQICKCNMGSCGNQVFPNFKQFIIHCNRTHEYDRRICIFEGCCKCFGLFQVEKYTFSQKFSKIGLVAEKLMITFRGGGSEPKVIKITF